MQPLAVKAAGGNFLLYNNNMEVMSEAEDRRNLVDEFKGREVAEIRAELDERRSELEIAIENVEHDFNLGTIIRSANNFNVQCVHIIGRRKMNRRGAMCTEKYLEMKFWTDPQEFYADQKRRNREVVAIENNIVQAKPLSLKKFVQKTTLLFGCEKNGLTEMTVSPADDVREIESFGSTRSVNVGVAAGIAMYEWARQCLLSENEQMKITHGDEMIRGESDAE